jgi:glycosyltransferase involved in cell wall biosynthesis
VTVLHVVLPWDIDDPRRPSGGNVYDRRVCDGLGDRGWTVREHAVPGRWPWAEDAARVALAGTLAGLAEGTVVLLDGLVASAAPEVVVPAAARLRLVVLLHLPVGESCVPGRDGERAVLSAVAAVVTTSRWAREWLLEHYALAADRVHVAEAGVDTAPLAAGTPRGDTLLCVAAVVLPKGHDVLLAALGTLGDLSWRCVCVGPVELDPGFVGLLRGRVGERGLTDRVTFTGPLGGADLDAAYDGADVLVHPSRGESYGLVVTEALARGLPVVATSVGGVPEALGRGRDGAAPGVLVPPADAPALAAALRRWLADDTHRQLLRRTARERRGTLAGWGRTADRIAGVLSGVAQ